MFVHMMKTNARQLHQTELDDLLVRGCHVDRWRDVGFVEDHFEVGEDVPYLVYTLPASIMSMMVMLVKMMIMMMKVIKQ